MAQQAWTAPLLGVSLFASRESGETGARAGPLLVPEPEPEPDTTAAEPDPEPEPEPGDTIPPPPEFRVTDRTATRFGAMLRWRDWAISGARLKVEADSLLPFGLPLDRDGPVLPGGERNGWEAFASLPTPLDGLRIEGSVQRWEETWSYLPEWIYRGAFVFHDAFLPTENLELWGTLGVRGRDPMSVRVEGDPDEAGDPTLARVPFFQSWYARIQVRVVSVMIFVSWENFTVRESLQDFPERVLPATRAFYGVRWVMRN